MFPIFGEVTLDLGWGIPPFTVKLSFLALGAGDELRSIPGEAGRGVLPECIELIGAVNESFLAVFGVLGTDFETLVVLALLGVDGPLPTRCPTI